MAIDFLAHLRSEAATFARVARSADLAAPVPTCPGWDVAKLVGHLGRVHRWAAQAARTRSDPAGVAKIPDNGVIDWYEEGIGELVAALEKLGPEEPCWNFSVGPQVGSFWARRQAHETAIHRVDVQLSSGPAQPVDPLLAADGIDELFAVPVATRLAGKDGIDIGGSLHLHCTDVEGEWTVRTDDGVVRISNEHSKGDCAVRGSASDLLLLLWRRLPASDPAFERFGDLDVLDRWLALPAP